MELEVDRITSMFRFYSVIPRVLFLAINMIFLKTIFDYYNAEKSM